MCLLPNQLETYFLRRLGLGLSGARVKAAPANVLVILLDFGFRSALDAIVATLGLVRSFFAIIHHPLSAI